MSDHNAELYQLLREHTARDDQVMRQIASDIGELKGLMKGVSSSQQVLVKAVADQEVRLRSVETKVARINVVGPLFVFIATMVGAALAWIKGVKL